MLAHALRIAVASKRCLKVLQLDPSPSKAAQASSVARFRKMLELWGLPSDMRAEMVELESVRLNSATVWRRMATTTDLFVLDAEAQDGRIDQLLLSKRFANSRSPFHATLFVPSNSSRFVSPSSGAVRLTKILIPCISDPHPINALRFVSHLVDCLDQRTGSFTLLYVGSPDATPNINPPRVDGWTWVIKTLPGSPVEKILQQAECMEADLIVLTIVRMDIVDSPSDVPVLRSIPSEVIRRSRCPTLVVPTDYG